MIRNLTLEICCYSIQSVINAAAAKADRVELCADITSGGITPSSGLIESAVQVGIDVYVIIRLRGGDFFYSADEFKIMELDIISCKNIGVKGVVIGLLNKDGSVDKVRTKRLVELAYPMDVTFHRAIDMSNDLFKAMDDIYECGIKRILTSGGYNTALEGIEVIKQMVAYSENRLSVMAGSGVNANNIKQFYDVGVREFHSSATSYIQSQMEYRNPKLNMGNKADFDEYAMQVADFEKIKEMKLVLEKL
ncbi:MAG: copper homeostasis protein CutC [Bacteroidia bacterium]